MLILPSKQQRKPTEGNRKFNQDLNKIIIHTVFNVYHIIISSVGDCFCIAKPNTMWAKQMSMF